MVWLNLKLRCRLSMKIIVNVHEMEEAPERCKNGFGVFSWNTTSNYYCPMSYSLECLDRSLLQGIENVQNGFKLFELCI